MHHTKKLGVLPPPPPKFAQRFDFQRVTFSKRSFCKNKNVRFMLYSYFGTGKRKRMQTTCAKREKSALYNII